MQETTLFTNLAFPLLVSPVVEVLALNYLPLIFYFESYLKLL